MRLIPLLVFMTGGFREANRGLPAASFPPAARLCPPLDRMPIVRPDTARLEPMPVIRPDSTNSARMLVLRPVCDSTSRLRRSGPLRFLFRADAPTWPFPRARLFDSVTAPLKR